MPITDKTQNIINIAPAIEKTHCHNCDHDHSEISFDNLQSSSQSFLREHWNLIIAFGILVYFLVAEYAFNYTLPRYSNLIIHLFAYLLAGYNVLQLAIRRIIRGDIFNEFVLMSVATIGAFYIGAYSEGVAVMVFYMLGEWFQDTAVNRAKASIKALLDIRPESVAVIRNGETFTVHPSEVNPEEIILVKPGEKVALDGILMSKNASLNTSALTGESTPNFKQKNDSILAGMIALNTVIEIKVTTLFKDSKLSKILEMVQDATSRKSQSQLFISRFAKIYTPIVFFLAIAVVALPYFFVQNYVFDEWLYRGLVFLVISCPCALVISIPLGYFGGIGLASRNGILFKGGNFLDVMTKIDTVVMDKTGTLTKGVFKVKDIQSASMPPSLILSYAQSIEKNSTHPVAIAISSYHLDGIEDLKASHVEEIAGHGLKGIVQGKEVLAGNIKLLEKFSIPYPEEIIQIAETMVVIAIDGQFEGYITIADEIKEDSLQAIQKLHELKIQTIMLSGDKQTVVDAVAGKLGIDEAFGDLLPENKVEKVESLKKSNRHIAFVGDGVNDAPVIALADVGIAMGGLGSDATIETADVVIQNDQPSKIVSAIKAGRITRKIVWQNITIAMVVKVLVLILGAGGIANLWEAVIADVGVALIAILNAIRIQKMEI